MRTGSSAGGTGGNGAVVLRWTTANYGTVTCTGTLTTSGGDSICTFNYADSGETITFPAGTGAGGAFTYDNAGNLLTSTNGSALTNYTWNYRGRMTDTSRGATSTHYLYDVNDARVQQDARINGGSTSTTKYWNNYETTATGANATTTLYIHAGGQLVATLEGNGNSTSTNMIHTDHLGGTNVVSSASGALSQLLTYLPFGDIRQNEKQGTFNEKHKAIGQYYDDATALNYYNARYMSGSRGQFMGLDPVARDVAMMQKMPPYILALSGNPAEIDQTTLLSDPQMLNSYSYSKNNPITLSDPSGKSGITFVPLGVAVFAAANAFVYGAADLMPGDQSAMRNFAGGNLQYINDVANGTANSTPLLMLFVGGGKPGAKATEPAGGPKSPKTFITPTNPAQAAPDATSLPAGYNVRVMPPTKEYPNGYWVMTNKVNQPVEPTTLKPPSDAKTTPQVNSRVHVPLPPKGTQS
jgi:RHS repeat-associated protein